jgi:hypothetical protein
MTLNALRLSFVLGILVALAMYGTSVQLADWQHVSPTVMKHSPDAPLFIGRLQLRIGVFGGFCLGMGISVGITAFVQRIQIRSANVFIKAHWAVQVLPSLAVIGVFVAK